MVKDFTKENIQKANSTLRYLLKRNKNLCLQKGKYSSLMDNSQKLETQVLINRRVMNKWRYIRIVEYSEMKETYNTHNNMDES